MNITLTDQKGVIAGEKSVLGEAAFDVSRVRISGIAQIWKVNPHTLDDPDQEHASWHQNTVAHALLWYDDRQWVGTGHV